MGREVPVISIVDDDDLCREAVEHLVRSLGLTACAFASAELCLRSPRLKETRCLIADIQMPTMDGFELQQQLSELGFAIPIIFVTAFPDDAVKTRAMDAGAICFLNKPLDLGGGRLAACLQRALGGGPSESP